MKGFNQHSIDQMTALERDRFLSLLLWAFSIKSREESDLFREFESHQGKPDDKRPHKEKVESARDQAITDLLVEARDKSNELPTVPSKISSALLNILYFDKHRDYLSAEQRKEFERLIDPKEQASIESPMNDRRRPPIGEALRNKLREADKAQKRR